jgi:YD repeat-containing protein
MGRLRTVISDSGGLERRMAMDYNGSGQVTKRSTWTAGGSSGLEETEYVYGVQKGASPPASKIAAANLLQMIKYPDPTTGSPSTSEAEQESFAYDAQGEIIWRQDQNGPVHEFDYDQVGRRTADKVDGESLPGSVDSSILRIQTAYDALGRVTSVRSYDAASGGNVKNEVALAYNGFGQVVQSWQDHDGPVDVYSSPRVSYGYSEGDSDPVSRLEHIQYPVTNRRAYFHYDSGQDDYQKLDWVLVRPSAVSNSGTPGDPRLAQYSYQGLSRVVGRVNQQPTPDLTVATTYVY